MEQFNLASISNEEYFNNLLEIIKLPLEDYLDILKAEELTQEERKGKAINRAYIEAELKSFFANKKCFSVGEDENCLIRLIDFSYRQPIERFIENFIKPALDKKIEYKEYSIVEIYDILQKYRDEILKSSNT